MLQPDKARRAGGVSRPGYCIKDSKGLPIDPEADPDPVKYFSLGETSTMFRTHREIRVRPVKGYRAIGGGVGWTDLRLCR